MSERELIKLFTAITDTDEMERFFREIFTEKERDTLTLRWQLLKDLHAGKTQRSIAADYRISLCKITRGSKLLKGEDSLVRGILDEYDKKKKAT